MKKNSLTTAVVAGLAGVAGIANISNAANLDPGNTHHGMWDTPHRLGAPTRGTRHAAGPPPRGGSP